jgi:hypothetical protein
MCSRFSTTNTLWPRREASWAMIEPNSPLPTTNKSYFAIFALLVVFHLP